MMTRTGRFIVEANGPQKVTLGRVPPISYDLVNARRPALTRRLGYYAHYHF
jgi:hypothetical protein